MEYIILESKMNTNPKSKYSNQNIGRNYKFNINTPIFPKGLTYHALSGEYRAARWVKGKKHYISCSRNLLTVLDKLHSFNIENGLHYTNFKKFIH